MKKNCIKHLDEQDTCAQNYKRVSEIWKPIQGYNDKYFISDQGRVESLWNAEIPKILKTDLDRGWPRADLTRDIGKLRQCIRRSTAFLVAEHFLENPNNFKFVDFIDGNFKNVCLSNLTWSVNAYNPSYENKLYVKIYDPKSC